MFNAEFDLDISKITFKAEDNGVTLSVPGESISLSIEEANELYKRFGEAIEQLKNALT